MALSSNPLLRAWRFFLLILLTFPSLAGCVHRSSPITWKGLEAPRSTREAIEASFGPRRVALLVGINTYQDPAFVPLKFADQDALELATVLRSPTYGGFDRVVALTTPEEVNRERILKEIAILRTELRRDDTLIFYFSGHGTLAFDAKDRPRLYLVAGDTKVADLPGTAMDLQEIQGFFTRLPAERKALIVDACFHGDGKSQLPGAVIQKVSAMGAIPSMTRSISLGESEAHLFATSWGRPAREDGALRHGVYTYHLLQALTWQQKQADSNSDQLVTAYEAHDFARAQTYRHTSGVQLPEAYFRVVGQLDLYLAGDVTRRAQSEMGLLYFYGDPSSQYADATLKVDGQWKGVFPGAYSISPGEHRITVLQASGKVLFDQMVDVDRGSSRPIFGLSGRVPPRPAQVTMMGGVVLPASPVLHGVLGPVVSPTLEGRLSLHPGAGRAAGLALTLSGSWGRSGDIGLDPDGEEEKRRVLGSLGGEVGWRFDQARFAFSLGWEWRARFASGLPEGEEGCGGLSTCGEVVWISQGPLLQQVLPLLPGRLGLTFLQQVQFHLLGGTAESDAPPQVGISFTLGAGLEVGL